ncbi:MAG: ABC transporter permease [Acidobacteriia bacterium]|nr:ABC transporter permease [Terriglobia bacterium]
MSAMRAWFVRLGGLFGKERRDRELAEELESHLQFHIEDNLRAGMTPVEARRQALIKLGGVEQTKENYRDHHGFPWLESLLQDIRFGLRTLRKNPGFVIVAVLTLALGIGANSTIFSWINSTVFNPIPGVKHANEYAVLSTHAERDQTTISYRDYVDLRDRNQTFSTILAADPTPLSIKTKDKPERAWGLWVSENYFDALGVRPILGRGFLPSEDTQPGGALVAVISYHFWQTNFGGEQSVLGQTIEINRHPFEIVGVAPREFVGTQTGLSYDLWIPVKMIGALYGESLNPLEKRDENWFVCTGRLRPGVTVAQAQADLNVLMRQIVAQFPDDHRGDFTVTVSPLWRAPFGANFQLHTILFLLLAISGVVLLLACANVANLLLVRSFSRAHEMAIRLSLGATRWRLVRQSLVESLILSSFGGGIAMLFTLWTAGTLGTFVPPTAEVPLSITVRADRTVFVATFIVSVFTAIIFGILPALRSSRQQPARVLQEGTRRASGSTRKARLSSALVVAQFAMSLLLLVCAGLFIRSARMAEQFNPGFNPHHVLLYEYIFAGLAYDERSGNEFDRRLFDKLQEIGGAESATLSDFVPLSYQVQTQLIQAEGYVPQAHESMNLTFANVGPDFLRTLQIPLVAGREFTASDNGDSRFVAIVNTAFANRYWPHMDAVGKQIRTKWHSFTVVGVAENIDYDTLGQRSDPFVYLPLFQQFSGNGAILVRVPGDPLAAATAVQDAVHSIDADLPLFNLSTLDSRIALRTATQRIAGVFVGGLGVVALLLASIGIYGVLAYTTRQRTQEIGVRMALGAQPRSVLLLVLSQGLKLAILGLAVGLLVSLVLTRALSTVLFGVSPADPLTFVAVVGVLVAAVLLACWIPARRASRVDPMVALRYE